VTKTEFQCEFAQYFLPSQLDAPGAAQVLDEVNLLLARFTSAGWLVESMLDMGAVQLSIAGGALDGRTITILWTKGG